MSSFEEQYIGLRSKEGRLLSDEQVKKLPFYEGNPILKQEWNFRAKSLERIYNYLLKMKPKSILEIGCGNGWFAKRLSSLPNCSVKAIDVNQVELEQALRIFGNVNPVFLNADIFSSELGSEKFDCIVLNASIQYFSDLTALIYRLRFLLGENGEIHIIDTPFYNSEALTDAKERSKKYFEKCGFPEMNAYYFHHDISLMNKMGALFLYKPFPSLLRKIFRQNPFPWMKLLKQ